MDEDGNNMYEQTLNALIDSIQKWVDIKHGMKNELGATDCKLCKLFQRQSNCNGCPVAAKDFGGCLGSPYTKWAWHQSYVHGKGAVSYNKRVSCPKCEELAEAEEMFLRSLLPILHFTE